jgi:murein DD-endopeptidase MepM/ murein hydrolase activator NlpD
MKYKFTSQPLAAGLYEPEGIYLSTPFDNPAPVIQFFGQYPEHYTQFRYHGVPLKGHVGVDFALEPGSHLFAVDDGRVVEISFEADGFERYVKLDHRWGESLYALVGEIAVDTGQAVRRNEFVARSSRTSQGLPPHLHFGIRIHPYSRFDGWGGFTDPLPFLNPSHVILPEAGDDARPVIPPHAMPIERPGLRRP